MSGARPLWRREEICYCSNVHTGEGGHEVIQVIRDGVAGMRQARGLAGMSAGLWLSARAVEEIDSDGPLAGVFTSALEEGGIALTTLNGFPYGDFHATRVKERVYLPDWTDARRLDYTLRLANILARHLPASVAEGSISTLPLGYRDTWSDVHHAKAADMLCRLAGTLAERRGQGGRHIRVCLEMEPGCVLEETAQMIDFFDGELAAAASRAGLAHEAIREHLGVCYDICHQAVMFEEPAKSLQRLRKAGITVGKIQISSALHVPLPGTTETRDVLTAYAEPRYLHQVRTHDEDGCLIGPDDLGTALADETLPATNPWRIHFHVPVQATQLDSPRLQTTRQAIETVFDFLADNPGLHPQLEVETYTWQVLPAALRPGDEAALIAGLRDELAWVEDALRQRSLLAADDA